MAKSYGIPSEFKDRDAHALKQAVLNYTICSERVDSIESEINADEEVQKIVAEIEKLTVLLNERKKYLGESLELERAKSEMNLTETEVMKLESKVKAWIIADGLEGYMTTDYTTFIEGKKAEIRTNHSFSYLYSNGMIDDEKLDGVFTTTLAKKVVIPDCLSKAVVKSVSKLKAHNPSPDMVKKVRTERNEEDPKGVSKTARAKSKPATNKALLKA